jgi:hypothetical protein
VEREVGFVEEGFGVSSGPERLFVAIQKKTMQESIFGFLFSAESQDRESSTYNSSSRSRSFDASGTFKGVGLTRVKVSKKLVFN